MIREQRTRSRLRKLITRYFNSWRFPTLLTGGLLLLFVVTFYHYRAENSPFLLGLFSAAGIGFLLALVTLPIALIWLGITKRWKKLLANLVLVCVLCIEMRYAAGITLGILLFPPGYVEQDHFSEELFIPGNIEVSEPFDQRTAVGYGNPSNPMQAAILQAVERPGNERTEVTAKADSLAYLRENYPDILERYFSISPQWNVSTQGNGLVAYRRWSDQLGWQFGTSGSFRSNHNPDKDRFSVGCSVGFTKTPAFVRRNATSIALNQTKEVEISAEYSLGYKSSSLIQGQNFYIQIEEDASSPERRLTKAVLASLESELKPLADSPTEETIRQIVPTESIRLASPSLQLKRGSQPGLYQMSTWINPGEPGTLHLKAFEVTTGIQLSVPSFHSSPSGERIGWSADETELFLANSAFKVEEWSYEQPYAARFEVWFSPDSGEQERKLIERNFLTEGWQP